jgi:hypothetical protein
VRPRRRPTSNFRKAARATSGGSRRDPSRLKTRSVSRLLKLRITRVDSNGSRYGRSRATPPREATARGESLSAGRPFSRVADVCVDAIHSIRPQTRCSRATRRIWRGCCLPSARLENPPRRLILSRTCRRGSGIVGIGFLISTVSTGFSTVSAAAVQLRLAPKHEITHPIP